MKLDFPATSRNREPICDVLNDLLPDDGTVLEIAAGSGQHAAYLSGSFPTLRWQPTDLDEDHLASIAAWAQDAPAGQLLPPRRLDVTEPDWWSDYQSVNVILNMNMIHISPWEASVGLMTGAGHILQTGELLYLYGPFFGAAEVDAPSNRAFDQSLRSRDSRWGVRQLSEVVALADSHGLTWQQTIPMPANNFSVVFLKR